MFNFRIKQRKKEKPEKSINEKRLREILKDDLGDYIKREDLSKYLEVIEREKKKKVLWDSLSAYKKIKLLRYAIGKKGMKDGKK